jgi:hypothetical protein
VTQQYRLPAAADLRPGQHYYVTGMSDHDLMALSEATRREFALLTLEHPNGRTVQMLIPGGRNGGSVDIPRVQGTQMGIGPNVQVTRVLHTHPPGSVASLDDFLIANRNGYTVDILMREESGRLGLQRITPQDAAAELRLRWREVLERENPMDRRIPLPVVQP